MEKIEIKVNEFVNLLENYALYGERGYYVDPLMMNKIIVDKAHLSMSMDELVNFTRNAKVTVSEEEIKSYLEERFKTDDADLKQRIENRKPRSKNIGEWTDEDIKNSAQEFMDQISASKYFYDEDTFQYFEISIGILRLKTLHFFDLVEKIIDYRLHGFSYDEEQVQEWKKVLDELNDYDIKLLENGFIYYEDLIRLLTPLIQNLWNLKEMVDAANHLETYLTFTISTHFLQKDGFSENDLYPRKALQVKALDYDGIEGYIPLSEKQKMEIRQKDRDDFRAWLDRTSLEDDDTPKILKKDSL